MKRTRSKSRKANRRRQRGGGTIIVYGLIDSKFTTSMLSSPTAGVTAAGGAVQCTLTFNPAVTVTGMTFSTHNGTAWGAEKQWNTRASGTGAPVLRAGTKPLVAAVSAGFSQSQTKIDAAPLSSVTVSGFNLVNLGSVKLDTSKKDTTVNGANGANLRITITTNP